MKRLPKEVFLFSMLLISVFFTVKTTLTPQNVTLEAKEGIRFIELPFAEKFDDNERFKISFDINTAFGESYSLRIVPDDCAESVSINGKTVSLQKISGLCNFGKGFELKANVLDKYINKTNSHYEVELKNRGGAGGLSVFITNNAKSLHGVFCILSVSLLVLLSFCIFLRLKIPHPFAFLLSIGIALRTILYVLLPYTGFTHDVDGHIAYSKYIAENVSIPNNSECWSCYHPPLYYVSTAPSFLLGNFLEILPTTLMQLESLLFSSLFLVFGFYIFKFFLKGTPLTISILLLSFWPTLLLMAPRIGNDQLFYLLHAITFFGAITYVQKRSGKHLFVAAIAAVLAFYTKSSGMISFGIVLLALLLGYFPRGIKRPKVFEICTFITLLLFVSSLILKFVFNDSNLVENASGLHRGLLVENAPANYLFFDLKSFITEPYTNPWQDSGGRQYFLNYLLKTSLFGEFKILENQAGTLLATLLSISLLFMIIQTIKGFFNSEINKVNFLLLAQFLAFFAALLYLRIQLPYSCSNDFRYIMPILLSFLPFVALGVNGSLKWKTLSIANILLFITCSGILMLSV